MRIEAGQTYTVSSNLSIPGEKLEIYGKLLFDPTKSAKLSVKDIINYGVIEMKPASASIIHDIEISPVDQNRVVGGGMDHLDSDPGIWNMGKGIMNIQGAYRKRFTKAAGSIAVGATTIPVQDASGWRVGDEIIIGTTTDQPKPHGEGVIKNDATGEISDPFMERQERRILSSVNGNTVSFTTPIRFNHLALVTKPNKLAPQGRIYTAHIANLTSNVKLHGKGAHIFSCSHSKDASGNTVHNLQKQCIDQAEIYDFGPRKFQGDNYYNIKNVIGGRYAMHFHHGGDGSIGTIVSNCAFHDNNSRAMVPHTSNGITFKGNAVANNLGEMCWWDIGEISNDITYDGNLGIGIRWDKILAGIMSFNLGIGGNCKCINNWVVYGHVGDENGSGCYQWSTNNESVWLFDNNGANSCNCAYWTWQNSGRPHAESRSQCYCCFRSVSHGAYGNPYIYSECEFYQAPVHHKAAASIAGGSSFERTVFDGMNVTPWLVNKETSAAGASFANQYRECEFKDAPVAMRVDNFPGNGEFAIPVEVELTNCTFTNIGKKVEFYVSNVMSEPGYAPLNIGVKIQNGNTAERHTKSGVVTIAKFAPDKYGTGDGLKAEYYKGLAFEQKVMEKVESMVRHDMWRVDAPIFPEGVYYKLNVGAFSVRWTGFIEPWRSGNWTFRLKGGSGYRLWINNQLLIDSPQNKGDGAEFADSGPVNLTGLTKHTIKVECYEPGDYARGIELYWKNDLMRDYEDVPMSQLYSGGIPPPPPIVFKSTAINRDFKKDCPVGYEGTLVRVVLAEGAYTSTVSLEAANLLAFNAAQSQANNLGTCNKITNMPDTTTFKWTEYIAMYEDLRKAGIDTEAEALSHWNTWGKPKENRWPNYEARFAANGTPVPGAPVPVNETFSVTTVYEKVNSKWTVKSSAVV